MNTKSITSLKEIVSETQKLTSPKMNSLKEIVSETQELISPKTNHWKTIGYLLLFLFVVSNLYTYYFYDLDLFRHLYQILSPADITPISETTRAVSTNVHQEKDAPKIDEARVEEEEEEEEEPEPDSSVLSEIQDKRKQGWCYIGTDRGYRSCMQIGTDDICLSGKIYDKEYRCKHPELR